MKQITSLWLLVLFMVSTTLIAQSTSTGVAWQKAAAANHKTGLQQNLNADVQPGIIPNVKQGSEVPATVLVEDQCIHKERLATESTYTYPATTVYTDGESAHSNPDVVIMSGGSIVVTPLMLEETHVTTPQQTEQNLTFANNGSAPVDVTLSIDLGSTLAPALTINPEAYAKKLAERQAAEDFVTSTGLSPITDYIPPTGKTPFPVSSITGKAAYAYVANDHAGEFYGPIAFDLEAPDSVTQLAPTTSPDFISGACWAEGIWYACMASGRLYTIDEETGEMFIVGPAPDLNGIAWDETTMYGASSTDLYRIDPASGTGTPIGAMGNAGAMVGIGCDADGELYGYDIFDDNFYSIDKTTGAATVIGPLGYDFNFAQDMSFDKATNTCYIAGYKLPNYTTGLFTVNVETGAATHVGSFPSGYEITGFAIPSEGVTYANDLSLPWIVSPNTGVDLTNSENVIIKIRNNGINTQSNFPWSVTWDGPTGAGSANGTYTETLAGGETVKITIGTADLSIYGDYTFEACVTLAGDENPGNNCKTQIVTNLEPNLCTDNLYLTGCSLGDGLVSWKLSNINVPNIPCYGIPPWYHDYRDKVHELTAGETYKLTVQAGIDNTYLDVWIDFNNDGLLTDDELVINDALCIAANTPYDFNLTIPQNVSGENHWMRVRTNWNVPVTDPCITYSYGNCCDFKANTGEGPVPNDWLWIAEDDLTFTLPADGGTKVVEVHFNSEGLEYGDYMGAVNVVSNDPINPMIEVPAILHFIGDGALTVDPEELTETHDDPPQITSQTLELTNTTGAPVSWTLAIDAGSDAGALNLVPEVSTETPVYNGQIQVESQHGVTPGEMVEGPAYTNYAIHNGTRGELYNNGEFITAAGVGSNGTDYSELQDASLGMTTYGSGCQVSAGNSIADDFVVTDNWTVESFTFFAYQTGSGNTSTLNDVRCQIYDGDPSAGGTVIWGNLTTNLMTSTSWTNAFRVLESSPSENRPIFEIVAGTSGLTLSPGTYWVEMQIGGTAASGPWAPPITIVGQTTTGNSIQKTATGWAPLEDVGPQGLPFIITGTGEVAPWLSASPVSGTIPAGETIPINVSFNSNELELGTYNGSVTISSSQPDLVVPVTFNVEAGGDPEISVNPTSFDFELGYNDQETKVLNVSNVGNSDLNANMSITYGQDALAPVTIPVEEYVNVINPEQFGLANTANPTPSPNQTDDEVIRYDNGVNSDAIGLTGGGTFEVSAYWPASSMGQYVGMELTSVEIYINDPPSSCILKIYDQGSATTPGSLLHEQTLSVNPVAWNNIVLSSPVSITGNDIWIGYEVTHDAGLFTPGCDAGPAVAGFGDMISLDGVSFEPMSGLGLNYNWNIAATLSGDVLVEWLSIDPMSGVIAPGNMLPFNVTADSEPFGGPTDETYYASIWIASNDPTTPMLEVPVTLLFPVGMRDLYGDAYIMMFPNPANNVVNLSTNYAMSNVKVVNQLGQVVLEQKPNSKAVSLNTTQLQAGIYFVKIISEAGESIQKLVIQ